MRWRWGAHRAQALVFSIQLSQLCCRASRARQCAGRTMARCVLFPCLFPNVYEHIQFGWARHCAASRLGQRAARFSVPRHQGYSSKRRSGRRVMDAVTSPRGCGWGEVLLSTATRYGARFSCVAAGPVVLFAAADKALRDLVLRRRSSGEVGEVLSSLWQ